MNARRAIVSVTAPERNGDVADLAGFIPFSDIDVVPGYTPLHLDPEGVVRSFTRPPRGVSTFPLAAARHSGPAPANAIIDYPGPAGTFPSLSYVDVLHGHFDPKAVRGRIAIIGSTATVLGDAAIAA